MNYNYLFEKNLGENDSDLEKSSSISSSPLALSIKPQTSFDQQSTTFVNDKIQIDNRDSCEVVVPSNLLHNNHVNNGISSNNTSCNIINNTNDTTDNKTILDEHVNDNISIAFQIPLSSSCSTAYDVKEQKYYAKTDTLSSTNTNHKNNDENANNIGNNNIIHNFDSNANNINNNLSLSSPLPSSSSASCFNSPSTLTVADALAITKNSKDTDEKEI